MNVSIGIRDFASMILQLDGVAEGQRHGRGSASGQRCGSQVY